MNRIPPRFEGASFDTFRPKSGSQVAGITAVQEWVKNANTRIGPMLALVGKQGTGKSHLLYSAFRDLAEPIDKMDPKQRVQSRAQYPFCAPWYALADDLRYGRTIQTEGGTREMSPPEIRSRLWEARVVLLDEVRPTAGTQLDATELAKFACHAYDNRIAVLITTNFNPLAEVMGEAAASRFTQVVIDGPDHRQVA
jgi:hypothetical protein